ncbi:MAG: hypothetical protein H7210_00750 [Pyrinomonadaceae bacterium]|nr:hypothetical protein [Phycisphaerales bacterium]
MSSCSFRALLFVAAFLTAVVATAPAHAQTPFRDAASSCSVTFPKDWKQAAKDKVDKLKRDASVTVDFRAGFAKSLKSGAPELPLAVLVWQAHDMSGVNYDNLEERYEGDMRTPMFGAMQVGATEFGFDTLVSNLSIAGGFAGQKSDVKGVVYTFLTRKGLVHLACFDTAKRFEASLEMFDEIASSVAIDPGQEFSPKQTVRRSGGRRGLYGVGGGIAFIVLLGLRAWASR